MSGPGELRLEKCISYLTSRAKPGTYAQHQEGSHGWVLPGAACSGEALSHLSHSPAVKAPHCPHQRLYLLVSGRELWRPLHWKKSCALTSLPMTWSEFGECILLSSGRKYYKQIVVGFSAENATNEQRLVSQISPPKPCRCYYSCKATLLP